MLENQTSWEKYEEYTRIILNDRVVKQYLKQNYNLFDITIQPKKKFLGVSGAMWEIDAYGYNNNDLILIECKHYKNNTKVEQNIVAAFAYIIRDLKAKCGIIITTVGLQSGANKVATHENIQIIQIHQNSTDKHFFIRFSKHNQSLLSITDKIGGISAGSGKCEVTHYPLQEARKRLIQESQIQGKNKTDFSYEDILKKAKQIMSEDSSFDN